MKMRPWKLERNNSMCTPLAIPCLLVLATVQFAGAQQSPGKPAAPIAEFVDIAEKSGIATTNVFGGKDTKKYIIETTGTGVAIFDYDNDGWPDIFIVNGTTLEGFPQDKAATNHLYRNNHDGTFTDVTKPAGLARHRMGTGRCVGDYDNDGWEDVYVTYYGKNRLYHNNRKECSPRSPRSRQRRLRQSLGNGLRLRRLRSRRVARSGGRQLRGFRSCDCTRTRRARFLRMERSPRDVRSARAAGGEKHPVPQSRGRKIRRRQHQSAHRSNARRIIRSASPTFDFDNDGWPDIYIACDSTASILFRNNHDGTFTDVAVTAGAAYNEDGREQAGMGVTIGDFNGDGRLDIFKTNFSDDTSTLYRNNGNGTFDDVTFAAGLGLHTQYLGWGAAFLDFDNDGWPDLLVVNGHVYPEVDKQHLGSTYPEPRILYHNNGNGAFADISADPAPASRPCTPVAACHRRSLERWPSFRRDQQHERPSQLAGKPGALAESLDRDPNGRHEVQSRRHRCARFRQGGSRVNG